MTTDTGRLLELAERSAAATGPDRMLDRAIQCHDGVERIQAPKFYTASLDAAMSLVPEGWFLNLKQTSTYDRLTFTAEPDNPLPAWTTQLIPEGPNPDKLAWRDRANGEGATLTLALCAASLRARAASATGEG